MNSSLMSLTSHYAKVQFRLQQIVSAPADSRDQLLKDLERFAFRGIPDIAAAQAHLRERITTEKLSLIHI